MKNRILGIVGSVVTTGALAFCLVGCAADNAADTSADSNTSVNSTYSNDVMNEETIAVAQELLSENVSWDVPADEEYWAMYTNNANSDNPIIQCYVWSEDGTHAGFIAFSEKDHIIHGLDSDHENLIEYSQVLSELL